MISLLYASKGTRHFKVAMAIASKWLFKHVTIFSMLMLKGLPWRLY